MLPPLIFAALVSAPVFLSVEEVIERLNDDSTSMMILDARTDDQTNIYLPKSIKIDWRDFLENRTPTVLNLWAIHRNSKISTKPERIVSQLSELGLHPEDNILVYGNGDRGFGEEARVWWMLKYFGFQNVAVLDGGIARWRSQGLLVERNRKKSNRPSVLQEKWTLSSSFRITLSELRIKTRKRKTSILDTRSYDEYMGKTPYFSKRGGRIPRAKHLFWKRLMNDDSTVLSRKAVDKILRDLEITRDSEIITYCTGGVRSAFVHAVLVHYGYSNVRNYDGSWWEWSQDESLPVELGNVRPDSRLSK